MLRKQKGFQDEITFVVPESNYAPAILGSIILVRACG
jgi:hypothetical protein